MPSAFALPSTGWPGHPSVSMFFVEKIFFKKVFSPLWFWLDLVFLWKIRCNRIGYVTSATGYGPKNNDFRAQKSRLLDFLKKISDFKPFRWQGRRPGRWGEAANIRKLRENMESRFYMKLFSEMTHIAGRYGWISIASAASTRVIKYLKSELTTNSYIPPDKGTHTVRILQYRWAPLIISPARMHPH